MLAALGVGTGLWAGRDSVKEEEGGALKPSQLKTHFPRTDCLCPFSWAWPTVFRPVSDVTLVIPVQCSAGHGRRTPHARCGVTAGLRHPRASASGLQVS